MNVPYLLSQILKGTWAINPKLLGNYQPIVMNLLSGNYAFEGEKPELEVYAIDARTGDKSSVFDEAPQGSIAIIPIKGVMMKEDGLCSYGTRSLSGRIAEAVYHKNISGVILDIDSGGGAVDAIAPIQSAILQAKAKGKPVIALCDMAASAAYYSAIYADHIMADNDISSEFGSIGVLISFADVQPMWEREGVKFHTIYAPESTHKNQEFEKALKGDYDLIKSETLSPIAKKFMQDVRKERQGKVNITVEGILNGRMFYAKDAKKYGLIDSIGNLEKAVELAHKLSNQNK